MSARSGAARLVIDLQPSSGSQRLRLPTRSNVGHGIECRADQIPEADTNCDWKFVWTCTNANKCLSIAKIERNLNNL